VPPLPINTLSLKTLGAPVMYMALVESTVMVLQTSVPFRRANPYQTPVPGREDHLVLPERDTSAVAPADAHALRSVVHHFGIIGPEHLTGRRVHGAHLVQAADEVEHAVRDERRGHEAAILR